MEDGTYRPSVCDPACLVFLRARPAQEVEVVVEDVVVEDGAVVLVRRGEVEEQLGAEQEVGLGHLEDEQDVEAEDGGRRRGVLLDDLGDHAEHGLLRRAGERTRGKDRNGY